MKKLLVKQTIWNLTPLFKNDDDPEMAKQRKILEKETYKFINRWKGRGDYLEDPKILKQALDEYEKLMAQFGTTSKEGYYFWLRTQQDQNDPKLKAKFNKIDDLGNKIQNDLQFFYLKLAKVSPELQQKFLNDINLKVYKHYLEKLFNKSKHLLSEPEEKIFNLLSSTSYDNWAKMTSGFLAEEERDVLIEDGSIQKKNFSEIITLLSSKNKKVRDKAASSFNDILKQHLDVAEAELNSVLAYKKTNDELRKLPRPDSGRHLSDDIDTEVIDTLVSAIFKRFDIAKSYYKLKAELLGVKKLEYHEKNIEYGDLNKEYNFSEAVNLIYLVFINLDPKFGDILERFNNNGQIDVYPKKGKKGGAFCSYGLPVHPTYVLLNHTGNIHDVLTIAHEIGHGINFELMRVQNSLNFGTPTSTAEVASTFMEDFVLQELIQGVNDAQKLTIMMAKLDEDISTIFRQIACYMFETELHKTFREKGYLSKEEIGKLFQKHMQSYMGNYVKQSPGSENWWVYWSHIRNFFYNYSYSFGLLISKSLQASVRQNPQYINKVKGFLSAGLSDSPKNIFLSLGIDITDNNFWNQGLNEVDNLLKETEKLAKKLNKLPA